MQAHFPQPNPGPDEASNGHSKQNGFAEGCALFFGTLIGGWCFGVFVVYMLYTTFPNKQIAVGSGTGPAAPSLWGLLLLLIVVGSGPVIAITSVVAWAKNRRRG